MSQLKQKDFIKQISQDTGYTLGDLKNVFKSIEKVLVQDIKDGNSIKFIQGVVFEPYIKGEHMASNPRTHEKIVIPEKKYCKVNFSKYFKDKINEEDLENE